MGGSSRFERRVDVDEVVSAARFLVEVSEDGLHRRGDIGRVRDFFEARDRVPIFLKELGRERAAESEGFSFSALPAELRVEAAADFEEPAGLFARLVTEKRDERRDVLGTKRFDEVRRKDRLRHARARDGRDRVDVDVLFASFDRERVRETDEAELRHRVVRLAEVSVDAGGRCREDHAAVAFVAHAARHVPRGVRHAESAEHVHAVDEIPIFRRDFLERRVAEDARVVDDDVDLAERVHRGLDDLAAVLDGVVVGDRFAARVFDLFDDRVGRARAFARAVVLSAEIVDDDLRAARREQKRVRLPEPIARARDDDDTPIEPQIRHE